MNMVQKKRVDYGQDAPLLLRRYLWAGGLLASVGGLLTRWTRRRASLLQALLFPCGAALLLLGSAALIRGAMMIWSSRIAKLWAAERLLDELGLRGDETVLDVGCGRGVLLIGAARRLPRGRAIGIDLWSQQDQGANSKQATLENARAEGVADRVEVVDGDMCDLSFLPDVSVDAVVASKSIHNLADREARRQALGEMVRVLKPGGKLALMDIFLVEEFAEALQACGVQDVGISTSPCFAYPPLRIVTGSK
jgi:SAM-dependent methyltransferase